MDGHGFYGDLIGNTFPSRNESRLQISLHVSVINYELASYHINTKCRICLYYLILKGTRVAQSVQRLTTVQTEFESL
jgi:hypothetical protein